MYFPYILPQKLRALKAARRQNLHKRIKNCALTAVHTSWTLIRSVYQPIHPEGRLQKYPLTVINGGRKRLLLYAIILIQRDSCSSYARR